MSIQVRTKDERSAGFGLEEGACWQAVLDRDRSQDDCFVFGVTTTGVFCRPSCAARRPLRKNVRFFTTPDEARAAGLRPCRRCHPTGRPEDERLPAVRRLCAFIQEHAGSGDPLTLEVLAQRAGMSPSKLRRAFSQLVGVTPRQYVEACRFGTFKDGLKSGDPVTRAIYESGFGSSSQVYEKSTRELGMTPTEYREGGKDLSISFAVGETRLGLLLVAATDRGLCSVRFGDSREALLDELQSEFPAASVSEMAPGAGAVLRRWLGALERHLVGQEPHLDLPLDVRASAFRLQVWSFLRTIPAGETRSYTQVAEGIGLPSAVRAVASACAANPVALAIPCHRVIRSDGDLGGYRWGRERKERLLQAEGK
ncbi:MAG: bifunctional DNA-binding transcriptional regulator/O6-methylguanine-DNA methyltransferase Ada [Acidobacteria bacterium]|nr:bifunctional DNA-binding transcriptional regulator/O6-methylguanine-DNA methyltransferase Ada [Acidobacteriota bacterium]